MNQGRFEAVVAPQTLYLPAGNHAFVAGFVARIQTKIGGTLGGDGKSAPASRATVWRRAGHCSAGFNTSDRSACLSARKHHAIFLACQLVRINLTGRAHPYARV